MRLTLDKNLPFPKAITMGLFTSRARDGGERKQAKKPEQIQISGIMGKVYL